MAHTVMVTGADGFIGSHLTEELVKRGEKVRAFCLYNSFGSLGWIDTLPPEIRSEIDIFMGDVRDPNGVRTAMRGQERVFHLAALIAIPFSYHSPDSYVDTNIKGTLNVLNAARELGTQRVLVTSTSEVYGTAQYVPIDEKHPFQGQSPYSATKIGADRLAESFYRSFDLPVTIVRPFNTYGPRQSGRAIIPTIITQLLAGQTEIKLGSLTPTRDFNYVKDTANGFMTIADCDAAIGQELNIATGVEHSIGDLANELIAQINPNAKIVCEAERLRPEKSEVNRLLGDSTKLRELTGWAPQYTFEQGLAATIEFLRGNLDQYKVGMALSTPKMVKATNKEIKTMHTKCMGPDDMITSLSGGNQQKVIFGKWLERTPQVFMMDEPTRGIDVGAKYEIYELIIQMAKQGKTVIVVSSEMPEILGITNRIGVMSNGRLSGIVNTKETDQEELLRLSAKYL